MGLGTGNLGVGYLSGTSDEISDNVLEYRFLLEVRWMLPVSLVL